MGIKVVSLFGGMECGCEALKKVGIEIESYHSCEIDKYAIQTANKNHPEIIQMGDVKNWKSWDVDWGSIDLLLAGFPCQSWSTAGKQGGDTDPRGQLMWVMLDILNHIRSINPDVKFLFENVRMKGQFLNYVNEAIGVKPIMINSALLSAQNRERYYWTNIGKSYYDLFGVAECAISHPEDKKIILNDILEDEVDIKYFLSERMVKGFLNRINTGYKIDFKPRDISGKATTLMANCHRQCCSDNYVYDDIPMGIYNTPRGNNKGGLRHDGEKSPTLTKNSWEYNNLLINHNSCNLIGTFGSGGQGERIYDTNGKSVTLSSQSGGKGGKTGLYLVNGKGIRRLTPIECERLQTLPDNYTSGISDTQRYKCCGNGWTVDVVAHILKELKQEIEKEKELT